MDTCRESPLINPIRCVGGSHEPPSVLSATTLWGMHQPIPNFLTFPNLISENKPPLTERRFCRVTGVKKKTRRCHSKRLDRVYFLTNHSMDGHIYSPVFWSSSVTNIDYPGGRYAARTQSRLGRLFRTQGTEIIYQIAGSSKAKDLSLFRTYLFLSQRTKSHKKHH